MIGGDEMDWHIAERTAIAAVAGGTGSVLGGGKFANGAVTGAFTHLFNDEAKHLSKAALGNKRLAFYDSNDKNMRLAAEKYAGEANAIPISSDAGIMAHFENDSHTYDEIMIFTHSGEGTYAGLVPEGGGGLVPLKVDSSAWAEIKNHLFDSGHLTFATACGLGGCADGRAYMDKIASTYDMQVRGPRYDVNLTYPLRQMKDGKVLPWQWYDAK